ncbi:hypothetical protein FQN60_006700, partial [Etheostoma spectabile]
MSPSKRKFNPFKGRYPEKMSTSNLVGLEEDFPEFEAFPDFPTARAPAPDGTSPSVQNVDMCQQINKPQHNTSAYDTPNLVVRRGLEFQMKVTFDRPLAESDDFQLEFVIGENPTPSRDSLVAVTFNSRNGGPWTGRIVDRQDVTLTLGITPTPDALVGRFQTYVVFVAGTGMQRSKRDAATDLYMLFNAWYDAVFLPNEAERNEYVLNDHGVMYQGSFENRESKDWVYGQLGRSPTSWTGSVQILLQYAKTGVPVSFAQCWVYAGVFNTFLRALGIPARTVTNFNSAHDSNGNLKTELICLPDGSPDRENTRDSIWNYHCWNEVFIKRDDLPADLGGWQVVDATPQEMSDGITDRHRQRKTEGSTDTWILNMLFVLQDIFAVNSDVVYSKRDRYGTLTPYRVERDYIGKGVFTKSVGSDSPNNITHTYKYPIDLRTLGDVGVGDEVKLGQDAIVQVDFYNQSNVPTTIEANLTGSVIFYTGIRANPLKNHKFTITVPANQMKTEMVKIPADEYMPLLGTQRCLQFIISGSPMVQQEMFVNVSFTNPFNFALKSCSLSMEGAGAMSEKTHFYKVIEPQASIAWKESFNPRLDGNRSLVAV